METYGIGGVCEEPKFRFLIVSVDCMKVWNCGVWRLYWTAYVDFNRPSQEVIRKTVLSKHRLLYRDYIVLCSNSLKSQYPELVFVQYGISTTEAAAAFNNNNDDDDGEPEPFTCINHPCPPDPCTLRYHRHDCFAG